MVMDNQANLTEFTRTVNKGSLDHYFLKVLLEFEDKGPDISPAAFKFIIVSAMKLLFGDVGASISMDVVRYSQEIREAIIKVPSSGFVKLWSALMLYSSYDGHSCAFRVNQVTPHLISMAANSREFFTKR